MMTKLTYVHMMCARVGFFVSCIFTKTRHYWSCFLYAKNTKNVRINCVFRRRNT